MIQVGDLVMDKELGEQAVVIDIRNALYVLRSLQTGFVYPVPCGSATEQLAQ